MKKLAEYFVETEQAIAEKAVSQQQQKFMGMVHAMQKGEKVKGASPELKKVARTMKKSDAKDFAKTKHKGLPKKVGEQQVNEIDVDSLNQLVGHAIGTYGKPGVMAATAAGGAALGGAIAGAGKKAIDWYYKKKEEKREKERQQNKNVSEGVDQDLRDAVMNVFQQILQGAQAGEEMIDYVADELNDWYKPVRRSGDKGLKKAYVHMVNNGQDAEGDPEFMAQTAQEAIDILGQMQEDAVADFLAKGGKIEYGKTHKPRKSEKWQGSSHIGAVGGKGSKGRVTGLGANTNPKGGKPVVSADIHSGGNAVLKGIRQVAEARLIAEGGMTLDHIVKRFKHEVKVFVEDGDLDDDLYHALFDYYNDAGEMPYGVAKARTGDPFEWIGERFYRDLSDEGLVEASDPLEIPAYQRKHNPRLGGLAQLPPSEPVGSVRPENIPAVQRKAAKKDFPVSMDQALDTSDKISHLDTLRKMAGLPPKV